MTDKQLLKFIKDENDRILAVLINLIGEHQPLLLQHMTPDQVKAMQLDTITRIARTLEDHSKNVFDVVKGKDEKNWFDKNVK